jgi:PKHD-type hydroxylase
MITLIPDLLAAKACAALSDLAATGTFVDGRLSAGVHAGRVKKNVQLDSSADPKIPKALKQTAETMVRHPVFARATLPKAFGAMIISRYDPGMSYGSHIDDAHIGGVRADISFTIFLSDPRSYDGGELEIDTLGIRSAFKLQVGGAVCYPSGTLHRVKPITRGSRLALVGWMQSLVRDPARREMLFDLDTAWRTMLEQHGKTPAFDAVVKSWSNLRRMWIEP